MTKHITGTRKERLTARLELLEAVSRAPLAKLQTFIEYNYRREPPRQSRAESGDDEYDEFNRG